MKKNHSLFKRVYSWLIKLYIRIYSNACGGDPCYDIYPYYGIGPHVHEGVDLENPITFIGSTRWLPKEKWPDNYDDCDEGCGLWYCPDKKCKAICEGRMAKKEKLDV